MAEPIEMPLVLWTRVGPWKHVLDDGAHWRHLANTIESSVCGGDTSLCQITLTTCYLFNTILDLLLDCSLAFSCTSYLCCSKMRQLIAIRFVVNDTDVARHSLPVATVLSV